MTPRVQAWLEQILNDLNSLVVYCNQLDTHSIAQTAAMSLNSTLWWPLLLSALAGISTAVGGLIAVSFTSSNSTLAFLLGTAIGVMATVSGVELWWHSAVQLQDWLGVTAAVAAGAIVFAVLDPLLPSHHHDHHESPESEQLHRSAPQEAPADVEVAHNSGSSSSSSEGQAAQVGTAALHLEIRQVPPGLPGRSSGQQQLRGSILHKMQRLVRNVAESKHMQVQLPSIVQGSGSSSSSSAADDAANVPDAEVQIGAVPLLEKTRMDSSSSTNGSSSDHVYRQGLPSSSIQIQQDLQQQQQQLELTQSHDQLIRQPSSSNSSSSSSKQAGLLRLALVMALTMTLHNLPEGFAVAFSAFTDMGPIMTLAIALHNIPEGLVIAAPLYAATGSKAKALGLALASGLSEPLGALVALLVFKPFVTSVKQLDYVLAFTGGIMLSVCVLELIPEGRRCGRNNMLCGGVILGTAVMAWTLWMGA